MTDIRVPTLGESVVEATIAKWYKQEGDRVEADEPLCELETDKVAVEVPAPAAGVLSSIAAKEGDTVGVGAVIGVIADGASGGKSAAQGKASENMSVAKPKEAAEQTVPVKWAAAAKPGTAANAVSPSVRRVAAETGIDPSTVKGSGKDGRVLKGDMLEALQAHAKERETESRQESRRAPAPEEDAVRESRVRMTRLRQTIARRLKEAQASAAMLTTFNEVDLSRVMDIRAKYKDLFERKHGVRLGFMSFFAKACVTALKDIPSVNAEIDGEEIVYKNYYHLGIAVGTDRGLVVPVLRDADALSLADIEKQINDFGARARAGTLKLEELQGGTFTISNGGVYGSLMSTPILNAPQSGILGMHKIEQRPVVVDNQIAIRPMMYLALSYDHRLVDGREAVTFLVRVKECLEDPERFILDL
jgi:2-oxoglutarate dehydrogenase E2 component (dihydrolipoamide succinyltransferase)